MEVRELVTLDQIKAAKPAMIFYGANTCWWTHDPTHLGKSKSTESEIAATAENFRRNSSTPAASIVPYMERSRRVHDSGLPCDPRGGMLFQTDDVEGFLRSAEENAQHYGRHGLRAFMAAHHANSFLSEQEPRPWCSSDWDEYNDAIDRLDKRR